MVLVDETLVVNLAKSNQTAKRVAKALGEINKGQNALLEARS